MNKEIFTKVQIIISSILGISRDEIDINSSPHSVKKWDSVNHLNIILAIEEEFNAKFSKDEIDSMVSMKIIVATIESYQ